MTNDVQHQQGWFVCSDVLARGGRKFMGPFLTQEAALEARTYIERVEKRGDLWVDSEEVPGE